MADLGVNSCILSAKDAGRRTYFHRKFPIFGIPSYTLKDLTFWKWAMATHDHSYTLKHRNADLRFIALIERDDANATRIKRKVEVELERSTSDALGLLKSKVREPQKDIASPASHALFAGMAQFDVPAAQGRAVSAEGRVSVHVRHTSITKARTASSGKSPKSAAAKHSQYIERDAAVATTQLDPACIEISFAGPDGAGDVGNATAVSTLETSDEDNIINQRPDEGPAFADFALFEPADRGTPPAEPADPRRTLYNMPNLRLVAYQHALDVLLQSPSEDDLAADAFAGDVLRRTRAGNHQDPGDQRRLVQGRAGASSHLEYIERAEALARLDGSKVIFSNISADPRERQIVWQKIEEREQATNPDTAKIDFTQDADLLASLMLKSGCPAELWEAFETRNPKPFEVQDGRRLADWTKDNWAGSEENCAVSVKLARHGRVQSRIVCELPLELTLSQRAAVVREFCDEFERRRLPFVCAMHRPGKANSDRNWHFHLDYYERPISQLPDGRWDFEVVEDYQRDSGEWRKHRPYESKKNTELRGRDWIPKMRKRFVEIVNAHLERANHPARYDHRTYKQMGIEKVPERHLGPVDHPLEQVGVVTATGAENASKDWEYRLKLPAKAYAIGMTKADEQALAWVKHINQTHMSASDKAVFLVQVDGWQTAQQDVLEKRHMSEETRLRYQRAQSRAIKATESITRKLSPSHDDEPAPSEAETVKLRRTLSEAQAYLDRLATEWDCDLQLAAIWAAKAKESESRAGTLAKQLARRLELVKGSQSPVSERHDDGATIPAAVSQPAPVRVREDQPMPPRPIPIRLNVALDRLRREPFRIKTIAERHALDPADLRVLGINELDLAPPSVQARLGGIRSVSERQLGRLEGYAKSNPKLWISTGKTVCLRHDADPEMLEMEKRWTGDAQFQSDVMMIKNIADARDVNSQHLVGGETGVSRPTAREKSATATPQLHTGNNPAAAAASATMTREQPADSTHRVRVADAPTREANPSPTVLEPQSFSPLIAAYNDIDPKDVLGRQRAAAAICRDGAASKSLELLAPEDRKVVRADADTFKKRVEHSRAMAAGVLGSGIQKIR